MGLEFIEADSRLVRSLRREGWLDEAISPYTANLDVHLGPLCPGHPRTLRNRSWLANTLYPAERYQEAAVQFGDVLEEGRRVAVFILAEGEDEMKYGFTLPGRGPLAAPETLSLLTRKGEEFGYDALYSGDHILIPKNIDSMYPYSETGEYPGGPSGEALELLTLLAFLAGQTSKIRLVTSVIIVPYRDPLVAAKALATLDVLSQGRLVVGVGVGWMREEFEALNLLPFEERGAVTDEYIRAFKELWTSDSPHFEGKYVQFDDIVFLPKPVQKPHPPIWVGGESRPALRRTAELADGWYPLGSNPTFPMGSPEQLAAGLDRLAAYARRFGRDPSEIEVIYRTHQLELNGAAASEDGRPPFIGNADQIAADIRRYEEMGVGSMVLDFQRQGDDPEALLGRMERFADEVWPKV